MSHSDSSEIVDRKRAKLLASGAFYLHHAQKWHAAYLATFNQVWTHPEVRKSIVNKALIHEFCHNASCRSRPVQLHQAINWLNQNDSCPTANEYVDFVESIAIACYPLGLSKPISKRSLPRKVPQKYRDLAKRIIDIATRLSTNADSTILPHIAKVKMLFNVTTYLSRIVPLLPDQCSRVLDFIESLSFPEQWRDSHEVFEFLLEKTGKYVKSEGPESLGFTITRPRDPHLMISEMFQIFECASLCEPFNPMKHSDLLRSVFPILLRLITFDNAGVIPMFWLRRRKHAIFFVIQLWHETHELLDATEKILPYAFKRKKGITPTCGARMIYLEVHKAVKDFVTHKGLFCSHILFDKMLNMMPKLLTKYLDFKVGAHSDCFHCNHSIYDYKTLVIAKRFLNMSDHLKKEYVDAAKNYKLWLLNDCPRDRDIKLFLGIDSQMLPARLQPAKIYETQKLAPWIETIVPTRLDRL